jgi:hypothetical protein
MDDQQSEFPGRGGTAAYTVIVSGIARWCSRDALGRFIGYFYSECQALAAADAANIQLSLIYNGTYRDTHVVQAIFVISYQDGGIELVDRYFGADLDEGSTTTRLFEERDELLSFLERDQIPTTDI